jgi:hypothetical protein
VGIETIAVGPLHPLVYETELGADRRGASHGRIHMQPKPLATAELGDGGHRVHGE